MSAHTITRLNVNENYPDGLWWLKTAGEMEESRNGRVIVAPGPVLNCYHNPRERVLFSEVRDANPYFHFFEAMWMLAGREDLAYMEDLLPRMADYSDDGKRLQGAYGYRWRRTWEFDQLFSVIRLLEKDPESRRAVIQMWEPATDLGSIGVDIPCNTQLYVNIRGDYVDMTITCRSNDAIWGCYGANVVHFSFLQEFLACALRKMVGKLYQFSNNFHVYPDMPRFEELYANPSSTNYYLGEGMSPGPLLFQGDYQTFLIELEDWLDNPVMSAGYPFLSGVAYPMWLSFINHKEGERTGALEWAEQIDAPDWRTACIAWLTRRYNK
jgi:hypothetical protein